MHRRGRARGRQPGSSPSAPPSGPLSHTPFLLEIPYQVDAPTPVRLTFRQEGSRIPGTRGPFQPADRPGAVGVGD